MEQQLPIDFQYYIDELSSAEGGDWSYDDICSLLRDIIQFLERLNSPFSKRVNLLMELMWYQKMINDVSSLSEYFYYFHIDVEQFESNISTQLLTHPEHADDINVIKNDIDYMMDTNHIREHTDESDILTFIDLIILFLEYHKSNENAGFYMVIMTLLNTRIVPETNDVNEKIKEHRVNNNHRNFSYYKYIFDTFTDIDVSVMVFFNLIDNILNLNYHVVDRGYVVNLNLELLNSVF